MSRARSSMLLLGICVAAVLIAALRLATTQTPLPVGSSYSAQPDGAVALYDWVTTVGGNPTRLRDASVDSQTSSLVVLQPERQLDGASHTAFESVLTHGGTLVLAGDSLAWMLTARALGVTVDPVPAETGSVTTADGLTFPVTSRFRLRADNAQPLLTRDNGDMVALRTPFKQGSLIVIAAWEPLTNAGLNDEQTARFVYREIVSASPGKAVAFDELHHSFAPPTEVGTATVNTLLFGTPVGQALIYASLLTFAFALLSGRRLGPALALRAPAETPRTMYEHVQMLANLYRRARKFRVLRDSFARHYARQLARGGGGAKRSAALTEALAHIQSARSESELIAALGGVDDAG